MLTQLPEAQLLTVKCALVTPSPQSAHWCSLRSISPPSQTGVKESEGMKLLGLHACHCYAVLDWMAENRNANHIGESDYITIRNPHNRLGISGNANNAGIKNTVPNLHMAEQHQDAFRFDRGSTDWKHAREVLNRDRLSTTGLRALFKNIDEDGDGTIDISELGNALRAQGISITDARVTKLVTVADENYDGMLEIDEFLKAMAW